MSQSFEGRDEKMENKLSKWICRRLCAYQVIDKEYEDVYVYGLELIFSFLISTSVMERHVTVQVGYKMRWGTS